NREEDDLRPTDDVLERHITYLAEHTAVGGVVTVIAHHEIMPFRHLIDGGVVVEAVIHEIECSIAHATGQRLAPALDALSARAFLGLDEILDAFALNGLAVDVEHALDHLDTIARKPDDTLYVIRRVVLRQPEHHDIAAIRCEAEDAAGKQWGRERQRIV